jgi:tRNA pseudouridine38-40 synthase
VPNYRLLVEYDGTAFEGWQLQPGGARTVQGALEAALRPVAGGAVRVHGAGRTDAGVHALGQVANAHLARSLPPEVMVRALNAALPRDVAVRAAALVPEHFHARRDARRKRYLYRLWTAPARSPLRDRISLWVPQPLDLAAMRAAAAALCGTHDFASFRAAGSAAPTSVRTLWGLEIAGEAGGEVSLAFEGDGFLRHMVRNLVGTLLEVGRGRRRADSIQAVLAAATRAAAGPTAPARGLVLVAVHYDLDFPSRSGGLEAGEG